MRGKNNFDVTAQSSIIGSIDDWIGVYRRVPMQDCDVALILKKIED
jgi:hypothetical protein